MSSKTVDFYFTYLSPYAFLANSRIKKALEPLDVTLQYQPIAHTGSSDGPVFSEARYEHLVEEDVPRFAKQYGLDFIPQPPLTESYTASIGFLFVEDKGVGEEFNTLVFKSRWSLGQDISQFDILADIAEQVGFDRNEFFAAISNPQYKERLLKIRQQAGEAGVFGAPTFIYEGKKILGK